MFFLLLIIALTVIALLFVSVKLWRTRKALKDITVSLREKLQEDTNTLITLDTSDEAVCNLATELNQQLHTLRKEQHQLQNGNHELQNAITNIAHDLRTPLTAISGYVELLEQEPLTEKPKEYVDIIRERTESLKELTEELFCYSVVDSDSNELLKERIIVNDELEIALASAYHLFTEHGITPEIGISAQPIVRELDKKALQRIFGNILNNAVKYSTEDLKVTLTENGIITFANRAPNLSEIEVGKLFDRFYTVENARESTGLGLSIAKLLTEKMNGTIRAHYCDVIFSIVLDFPENKKA